MARNRWRRSGANRAAGRSWNAVSGARGARRRAVFGTSVLATALAALCPFAPAQSGAAEYPTIRFESPEFEFTMNIPAGWEYDRSLTPGPGDSLRLLRGLPATKRAAIEVIVFKNNDAIATSEWVRQVGVQVLKDEGAETRRETVQHQARDAIELEYQRLNADGEVRAFWFIIELRRDVILATRFTAKAAGADLESLRAEAAQYARSIRLPLEGRDAASLRAAFQRGREMKFSRLERFAHRIDVDADVRAFEIINSGAAVGFLTRQFERERRGIAGAGGKPGIRLRERSLRFQEDGSSVYTRLDSFASFDLLTELTELETAAIPPPGDETAPGRRVDRYVREGASLLLTTQSSQNQGEPETLPPMTCGPEYLSLPWMRLAPGLIGIEAGDPLAFRTLDPAVRELTWALISPLGPAAPDSGAYAWQIEEALTPSPGRFIGDARGMMRSFRMGEFELREIDAKTLESRYGPRRDALLKRLNLRE
ncbi:hypothetical protein YTPLAS18_12560 [Nitrospira sp.]|nr:hypothetical protein YTPLAS18_12560 [Nitrospira sp.]